jgi:hypothetical protein
LGIESLRLIVVIVMPAEAEANSSSKFNARSTEGTAFLLSLTSTAFSHYLWRPSLAPETITNLSFDVESVLWGPCRIKGGGKLIAKGCGINLNSAIG